MEKGNGRILCVDDHKDTCEMLAALLGLEGYQVSQANTVSDGLCAALSEPFDLILLDWVFKDGSGIELCKMLCGAGVKTPILFYSGIVDRSEMEAAMRAGAQGFLVKPVDIDDLLGSVSRVVSNGASAQQRGSARPPANSSP